MRVSTHAPGFAELWEIRVFFSYLWAFVTSFVIEGRAAKGGGKLGFVYRVAHYAEACRTGSLVSILFLEKIVLLACVGINLRI